MDNWAKNLFAVIGVLTVVVAAYGFLKRDAVRGALYALTKPSESVRLPGGVWECRRIDVKTNEVYILNLSGSNYWRRIW